MQFFKKKCLVYIILHNESLFYGYLSILTAKGTETSGLLNKPLFFYVPCLRHNPRVMCGKTWHTGWHHMSLGSCAKTQMQCHYLTLQIKLLKENQAVQFTETHKLFPARAHTDSCLCRCRVFFFFFVSF